MNRFFSLLSYVTEGILAGILISLGGAVFLSCSDGSQIGKYVGSLLFCTALFCICAKGYSLYTGKIGYLFEKHKKEDLSVLFLGLLGNVLGTVACGFLLAFVIPSLKQTALGLCNGKLEQGYAFALLRAFFCGILVFLAVDLYKNGKNALGIFLCIPTFILSGYEHSIADIFYFSASGIVSLEAFGYLCMILIGNSLGALLIPLLSLPRSIRLKTKHPSEQSQGGG